jgi:hypothetical protein
MYRVKKRIYSSLIRKIARGGRCHSMMCCTIKRSSKSCAKPTELCKRSSCLYDCYSHPRAVPLQPNVHHRYANRILHRLWPHVGRDWRMGQRIARCAARHFAAIACAFSGATLGYHSIFLKHRFCQTFTPSLPNSIL